MRKIICLVSALFLFGCATAPADASMTPEQAIAEAKAAQKKADSIKGGWVTTDKLIKKAEGALKKGDKEGALKHAKKAKHEAELAYAQADYERKNWSPPPYALPK